MKETYQLMSHLMLKNIKSLTNETLVQKYKETGDDRILATLYVKNYKLFVEICKKYSWVEVEDKATATLSSLYMAAKHYSSQHKTKFVTYLYNATNKALMRITSKLYSKNRVDAFKNISLEDYTCHKTSYSDIDESTTYADILADTSFDWNSVDTMLSCENSKQLTFKEKQFCKMVLILPSSALNTIRKTLNFTPSDFFRFKQKLRTKILKEMEN